MSGLSGFLTVVQGRRRVVVLVAAVLVLLSLAGALVVRWASAPEYDLANAPLAYVDRDGLRLMLRVGPGPYFIRELVPVSLTLTNISGITLSFPSPIDRDLGINNTCGSFFWVTESGGHAPTYQERVGIGGMTCPGDLRPPTDLAPDQTVSASGLLALTASGPVTFTAELTRDAASLVGFGENPFEGHWPQLHVTVNPTVPLQRTIWLSRIGTRVYVIAPPAARSHLVYLYDAGGGGCSGGSSAWVPITTQWIDEQSCAGTYGVWDYEVSAPGYAIADGTMGSL